MLPFGAGAITLLTVIDPLLLIRRFGRVIMRNLSLTMLYWRSV